MGVVDEVGVVEGVAEGVAMVELCMLDIELERLIADCMVCCVTASSITDVIQRITTAHDSTITSYFLC